MHARRRNVCSVNMGSDWQHKHFNKLGGQILNAPIRRQQWDAANSFKRSAAALGSPRDASSITKFEVKI